MNNTRIFFFDTTHDLRTRAQVYSVVDSLMWALKVCQSNRWLLWRRLNGAHLRGRY